MGVSRLERRRASTRPPTARTSSSPAPTASGSRDVDSPVWTPLVGAVAPALAPAVTGPAAPFEISSAFGAAVLNTNGSLHRGGEPDCTAGVGSNRTQPTCGK